MQEDLFPRLSELSMPVLLIAGGLDDKYRRIARSLHEALAGSRLCIVEGAGHNVHLERPDAYIRAVEAFLDELPPCQIRPRPGHGESAPAPSV